LDLSHSERRGLDIVRSGRTEPGGLRHIFLYDGTPAVVRAKEAAAIFFESGVRMEKISAALSPAITTSLCFA